MKSDATDIITPASTVPALWVEVLHAPAIGMDPADITNDVAVEQLMRMESLARFLKELAALVSEQREEFGLAVLKVHGELNAGNVRYYAGTEKKTKCRDVKRLLETLLEKTDIDGMAECLASGAWKHGACRPVLGDDYATHFEETSEPVIKEGKPAKKVLKAIT